MRFLNSNYFKILAALAIAFIYYNESFVNVNKDLDVFIKASRLVYEGKNCYDVWLHSGSSGLKYYYSPLFAILLYPVKDLPQQAYTLIWLLLNGFLIYRIFKLLPFFLPFKKLPESRRQLLNFLIVLSCGRFLFDCFSLGQMTFVLVWGTLEAFRLIHSEKEELGSAILAFIINIKIIPIAFVAYLIYRRYNKALVYTLSYSVIFLFLPALIIGNQFNNDLVGAWYSSISGTHSGSIMEDYGRQSLSAFVPALLMDTPVDFGVKRNFVSLNPEQVKWALNAARLLCLLAVLFLFARPLKHLRTKKQVFYEVAFACALTPLFFPHQGKYAFFYLLPAYAFVLFSLMRLHVVRGKKMFAPVYKKALFLLLLSFAFNTLTTDGLIGRRASDFCEYMQMITLGTFCLLAAMAILKPSGNNNIRNS